MRMLVVYESMYGNTHLVADAIAEGARAARFDVTATVVSVGTATDALVRDAELLVVGGPTHVHGMTRPTSRKAAVDAAAKPGSTVRLDSGVPGAGLREWFETLSALDCQAAAFDTRIDARAMLTGRASKGIAQRLRRDGATLIAEPESFLVTKESTLLPHELERARAWGAQLVGSFVHA